MAKIIRVTTIYKESFITTLLYNGKKYIDTEKGRIDKDEIEEIAYIGEEI